MRKWSFLLILPSVHNRVTRIIPLTARLCLPDQCLPANSVLLSLDAALGILSGRGAFAGIMSAGIIATITSLLGGTRVQCSGPTAPMNTTCAIIVTYAYENKFPDNIQADHFVNVILILTGAILLIMGVSRLGKFIRIVPNVVVSGFMNGIAALI